MCGRLFKLDILRNDAANGLNSRCEYEGYLLSTILRLDTYRFLNVHLDLITKITLVMWNAFWMKGK